MTIASSTRSKDFPFHDCIVIHDPAHSTSTQHSQNPCLILPSLASHLRLSSISRLIIKESSADLSSIRSDTAVIDDPETRSREKRLKLHRDLKGNEKNLKSIESTRPIPHRVDSSAVGVFGRRRRRRNRWWRRRATIKLVTRSTQRVSPICVDFLSSGRKTLATKKPSHAF
ncbi:hypothetical protein OIU79_022791 [Salix purpurea]|uniref:Uncharacterized protein n=1 Tax=Salix purpurea TaxID=77065 RepID=A0A9Q0WHN8_SALPP|nr:hypothetical protein OIU79_022791 [Salix purpurea]